MNISLKQWQAYKDGLKAIDEKAAEYMSLFIQEHGMVDMNAVVDYAYALATKYGEAAAELACRLHNQVARAAKKSVPAAEPAPTATYHETAAAVYGTAKKSPSTIPQTVGRLVKQAGADTTLFNAERDGAQFAWIPRGDTCAFCITLASRGWQNMSKKALKNGHAEHIHSNCDCAYAIRFSEADGVAGYDPAKYLRMYEDAPGATPGAKINAMRRDFYAEDKERINAQKRAAYAERRAEQSELTNIE